MKRMIGLAFLGMGLLSSLTFNENAIAGEVHETFVVTRPPSPEQIAEWSSLPGKRGYVFQMGDPTSWELESIAQLRGADRIRVTTTRMPGEDTATVWKSLAGKGVELVVLGAGVPTESEVDRLNRSGISRLILVLVAYPGAEESQRLSQLKAKVSITFATRAYPRLVDKPLLLAIPESIPLQFAMDYWPWYTHMDVLNMLPHAVRLRVTDTYPTDEGIPYLKAIKKLDDVVVEAAYAAPDPKTWEKLGELRVSWSTKGQFPSEEGLAAFERSAGPGRPRALIVDTDVQLSEREIARMKASPLPVEWIHAAP